MKIFSFKRYLSFFLLVLLSFPAMPAFADGDGDFPKAANPPRLVNDYASMMTPAQQQNLEEQLLAFEKQTSNQITIVTVKSLGPYEVSEYATELGNRWGVGSKKNKNGIVILASSEDRKINISPGYGLEGALTDAMCGRIIRNEMAPEFKAGNYFQGFQKAASAVIQATKGEYKADDVPDEGGGGIPILIIIVIIVLVIIFISSRGGGKGGGRYISRRGGADFLTGMIFGNLLGGGGSGGGWGGGSSSGGSSGGGGGFGGFGGGSFGGGGASGSW